MTSINHIRQRKLVQWLLGYIAAAWVSLQVLQFLAGSFDWPSQILRVASILAGAGAVVTLVLAWFHGEKGRQNVGATEVLLLAIALGIGGALAWIYRGAPADVSPTEPLLLPIEQNSIAVLPFADVSAGKDQDYFSDGITEEILNALARTPGLRVAARTSSFSFKDKHVPIDEIASRLRVAHVLEGSVRKAGDQTRITVQLIDAANGYQLWSEVFERELKDIFAVQDEISRAIVEKLRVQLTTSRLAPTTASTADEQAYDLYLRGRFFWSKRTPEALQRAVHYFTQAIAQDPDFARAHAGLASALLVLPLYSDAKTTELQPRARAAALRALALDSTLADAWATLGYVRMSYEHDWRGADEAFRKALRLNPNDANTHMWYGDFQSGRGNVADALLYYRRAVQLDPLSPLLRFSLGWVYTWQRRFDEGIAELQRAIELDPTLVDSYTHLARTRLFQGRYSEAINGLEEAVVRSGRRSLELGFLGHAYAVAGRTPDAQHILDELEARRRTAYVTPLAFAMVYIGMRDFDRAFEALERARKDGDMWLTENNADLVFDPLRNDSRWAALMKRLGIPAGN
jgi:adenylate cyclase